MADGQRVVMGSEGGPCEAWFCVLLTSAVAITYIYIIQLLH
jgi:hypothetical protein